jgi:hypothetical protein
MKYEYPLCDPSRGALLRCAHGTLRTSGAPPALRARMCLPTPACSPAARAAKSSQGFDPSSASPSGAPAPWTCPVRGELDTDSLRMLVSWR